VLGDGEEWDVLYIGVVFWVICDEMVNVVVLLISPASYDGTFETYITPPAETETSDVVGD
jgi:hypothetical protein